MSILDDVGKMAVRDPDGMGSRLEHFPEQLREAIEIGRRAALSVSGEGVASVAVLGMGGSAIGGELAAGYLSGGMSVPMLVVRGYNVPGFVGPDTLVYVSSYSGNTEETLSAYTEAREKGARVVCSTTGGEVGARANEHGHDVISIPPGYPPRAALGFGLVPLLITLGRVGLAPDPTAELAGAVAAAEEAVRRFGLETPGSSNVAKELAGWLYGHIPVVYGTAPATSVVANRWCGQFSENSKLVAHKNELPEMNHNEIVGWSCEKPLAGDSRVVFLRDADDHPRVSTRIEITRDTIAQAGAPVRDCESFGDTRLGRLLSLVLLGDYTSFYLAMLGGIDPTPVAPIDRLKKALAQS